jgi:hypothetical protein
MSKVVTIVSFFFYSSPIKKLKDFQKHATFFFVFSNYVLALATFSVYKYISYWNLTYMHRTDLEGLSQRELQ